MKSLSLLMIAAAIHFGSSATVEAQSELGGLPPLPDLDLGDPEKKLSWREKREKAKKAQDARYQTASYTRQSGDTAAPLGQRLSEAQKQKREMAAQRQTEIVVQNSLPSSADGYTPSGGRLQPFGEDDYWGGIPEMASEDPLVELPPMPDLRTPDQVTRKERIRDRRVAKYEARAAEAEAKRREQELKRKAVVTTRPPDPANALIQVESQQSYVGDNYVGNQEAPETVNRETLKPFNENSTFYQGNQKVYQGKPRDAAAQSWVQSGSSQQAPDNGPKFKWRNPFSRTDDTVQPVSFDLPGDSSGYAASTPSLDATPLTSNLRGIRVVSSTREVSRTGGVSVTGVAAERVDLPVKVRAVLQSRIGSSLTLGGLNQMVREAVTAYRRSDLPVVDVLVPEQEITTGTLQLVIIEGRLGDVIVEGTDRSEGRNLARQIRTERGEVIRESRLTEDLNWINKHPTRQVDLVFSPGNEYGETDVILRSQAYRDLSAFIAYENSGTEALGESRAIFGASLTGPLFLDMNSILSYQFTTNFDNEDSNLVGHSGVFATYLPWRHQITLLGAYVESEVNFGNAVGNFNTAGVNKQLSGRYGIPLPSLGRISHELEIGMDFKSSNSSLAFGGLDIFDTTSEIVQYSLGYNIVARDQTGSWRVDSEFVSSPGDNTNKNTDVIFATQRAGASANYTYGRVSIERDQQLPSGFSGFGRLQAQGSNSNLLGSETLGAGGFDSVRGFEQRIINGDSGVVGTLELRSPTLYPSNLTGFSNLQDAGYALLFYDFASLSSVDPIPGEEDRTLGSVGVGFRYQTSETFSLRVDYGIQVTEDGFDDGEEGRWHIGARATF